MSSTPSTEHASETQQKMAAQRRKAAATGTVVLGLVALLLAFGQILIAAANPGLFEVVSSLMFLLLAGAFTFDGFRRLKAA